MIAKQARHENELAIYASRHEGGVHEIYSWLCARKDELNKKWLELEGRDLLHLQGEARSIARLIKLIQSGPTIKITEGKQNG